MISFKNLSKHFERLLYSFFGGECTTVDYVNGADQLPPPLSKDEEQKAFALLEKDEKKARELYSKEI